MTVLPTFPGHNMIYMPTACLIVQVREWSSDSQLTRPDIMTHTEAASSESCLFLLPHEPLRQYGLTPSRVKQSLLKKCSADITCVTKDFTSGRVALYVQEASDSAAAARPLCVFTAKHTIIAWKELSVLSETHLPLCMPQKLVKKRHKRHSHLCSHLEWGAVTCQKWWISKSEWSFLLYSIYSFII